MRLLIDDLQKYIDEFEKIYRLDTHVMIIRSRIPIKELEMPKGKSYSFRNPPASKIDKKFGSGTAGMKRAPNTPSKSKMKSSSKKKY